MPGNIPCFAGNAMLLVFPFHLSCLVLHVFSFLSVSGRSVHRKRQKLQKKHEKKFFKKEEKLEYHSEK